MNEENKKALTIIDRIKTLLYNFDLEIMWAGGQIKFKKARMKLYENDNRKNYQRKFIAAKIDSERYELYIEDLKQAKSEIINNLEIILSKYTPRYKQVFIMYFIENKTYDEICEATNYTSDGLKEVIKKLKHDIIDVYYI